MLIRVCIATYQFALAVKGGAQLIHFLRGFTKQVKAIKVRNRNLYLNALDL
jgi:hypothetical protein